MWNDRPMVWITCCLICAPNDVIQPTSTAALIRSSSAASR